MSQNQIHFKPLQTTGLARRFRQFGVTDDSATTTGNLDGGGASYSAQAFAVATPSPSVGAGLINRTAMHIFAVAAC